MNGGAPQFCLSFQGMGMDVQVNGENAWTRAGIPFSLTSATIPITPRASTPRMRPACI
jgi:hypothetical protein